MDVSNRQILGERHVVPSPFLGQRVLVTERYPFTAYRLTENRNARPVVGYRFVDHGRSHI